MRSAPDSRARSLALFSTLPVARTIASFISPCGRYPSRRAPSSSLEARHRAAPGGGDSVSYVWTAVGPPRRAPGRLTLDHRQASCFGARGLGADRLIADAAEEVLARAGGDQSEDIDAAASGRGSEVLRSVSLFCTIPHEELVGVASLLVDRPAATGEEIVSKGGIGDSLYFIASGSVRVHDGERTLARLGEGDYFGELSLLDAAPTPPQLRPLPMRTSSAWSRPTSMRSSPSARRSCAR